MIPLICEVWKIKQTSDYNKKETDSDIENKLVVISGDRMGEEQDKGRGLRGTNYGYYA